MAKDKKLVRSTNCNGCGICVTVCPTNTKLSKAEDFDIDHAKLAIHVSNGCAVIDYDACIACGICTKNCPVSSLAMVQI
ncbi:MAG: 4Fe-4S binding protein [Candidatus Methanoperedens sp.]|nr:4Fe-4S binding protein [Candidatus Methanoperedens sp.]MCE8425114.1 4Fe-4S binding protein [Candidatus Methanoperedens sp.]MCE8428317.1 4Fe-4S binding protein [Candidatus Methanoperedens sp.]